MYFFKYNDNASVNYINYVLMLRPNPEGFL